MTVDHLGELLCALPNTAAVMVSPAAALAVKSFMHSHYRTDRQPLFDKFVASEELGGTLLAARSAQEFQANQFYRVPMWPGRPQAAAGAGGDPAADSSAAAHHSS